MCKANIVFGDDNGDNDCTFNCELEEGHKHDHKESGTMDGKKYILTWENEEEL